MIYNLTARRAPPKQLPWLIQLQYLRFIFPCNCVGWIGLPTNISLRGPAGCGNIDGTKLRFTLKVFTVGSGPKAFEASEIPKLRPRGRIQGDHSSTHTRKAKPALSRLTTGCSQAAFVLLSVHVLISATASVFFHNFRQDNIAAANIIENWAAWLVLKYKQIFAYTHETHTYIYICVCIYIHVKNIYSIYIYIYTYIYLFKSIFELFIYKCVYLKSTYIQTYIHAYIHTYITLIHSYIHTFIHSYIHKYIHTYIRSYIHTFIHSYIHTYIHTYMHTCKHAYIHYIHNIHDIT